MKDNEFEDLFKDSFKDFEADVNPGTWKNIQTALKGAGLGIFGKFLLNKVGTNTLIAVVSSAATVVGTVFVMNTADTKKNAPVKTKEEPKVVADAVKPSVDEIKDFLKSGNNTPAVEPSVIGSSNEKTGNNDTENKSEAELPTIKKDKKLIKELLSDTKVASISSSCVAGPVPMIINLSNIGSGKVNKWSFNDGTKPVTGNNPIKYFDEPGIYTVYLTSTAADGTVAMDSIKIEAFNNSNVEKIPTEFSPNGDGKDDVFVFNSERILKMQVTIYDKDAKVVYNYKGTGFNWDGNDQKGVKAKDGIYLYFISADGKDGKKYERSGKIKLTR